MGDDKWQAFLVFSTVLQVGAVACLAADVFAYQFEGYAVVNRMIRQPQAMRYRRHGRPRDDLGSVESPMDKRDIAGTGKQSPALSGLDAWMVKQRSVT